MSKKALSMREWVEKFATHYPKIYGFMSAMKKAIEDGRAINENRTYYWIEK